MGAGAVAGLGFLGLGLTGLVLSMSDDEPAKPSPSPKPSPKPQGGGGGATPTASMSCSDALKVLEKLDPLTAGAVAKALASGTDAAALYTAAENLETFASLITANPQGKAAALKAADCLRVRAKTIESSGKAPIFAIDETGDVSELDEFDEEGTYRIEDGSREAASNNYAYDDSEDYEDAEFVDGAYVYEGTRG